MRQIQHYQLDAQQCALFETDRDSVLTVDHGLLWVTIEGEETDYWLRAGEVLQVAAARRLWVSAEQGIVALHVAQEHRSHRFLTRNASHRLSLAARSGRLPGLT